MRVPDIHKPRTSTGGSRRNASESVSWAHTYDGQGTSFVSSFRNVLKPKIPEGGGGDKVKQPGLKPIIKHDDLTPLPTSKIIDYLLLPLSL